MISAPEFEFCSIYNLMQIVYMNQQLWNPILTYNLDAPFSEYGFSFRLAKENYWTEHFTQLAILEYKKFMYLAATSDTMVSPSGVVDVVWHQHLIFTQSYQAFCSILGKQVQHVPSTHSKEDFQKFRLAKERTQQQYTEAFGQQPSAVWACDSMYDSLHLAKGKFKLRSFVSWGIIIIMGLLLPFYGLLKPVYARLDNPGFIYAFLVLAAVVFLGLEALNRRSLMRMQEKFDADCFVYHLRPMELVYLKTQKQEEVINGILNEMLEKGLVYVNQEQRLSAGRDSAAFPDAAETQVLLTLKETGPAFYSVIMNRLKAKPVFSNIGRSMDAFLKYVYKSAPFGRLFYLNFSMLALLLLLACTRVITGVVREKPVIQIIAVSFLLMVATYYFLRRLTQQMGTHILPKLYKTRILPLRKENSRRWNYFLLGAAALESPFILMKQGPARDDAGGGSDGSGSCSSNCGSSCGSCGGCGGD